MQCFPDNMLNSELVQMMQEDQKHRRNLSLIRKEDGVTKNMIDSVWNEIEIVDEQNTYRLKEIIEEQDKWPGFSLVGIQGSRSAWLIVQHSNKEFMEYCVPLLKDAIDIEDAFSVHYAYLIDRVLVTRGEKQLYGTRYTRGNIYDKSYWQIEDVDNLNARRELIKLPPLDILDVKLKMKE